MCFDFQKWRQEVGITALILFALAWGLILLFMIFAPARLRLNRAVRDLLVASLWGLLVCAHVASTQGNFIGVLVPAILAGVYFCLALVDFREQHRKLQTR